MQKCRNDSVNISSFVISFVDHTRVVDVKNNKFIGKIAKTYVPEECDFELMKSVQTSHFGHDMH